MSQSKSTTKISSSTTTQKKRFHFNSIVGQVQKLFLFSNRTRQQQPEKPKPGMYYQIYYFLFTHKTYILL